MHFQKSLQVKIQNGFIRHNVSISKSTLKFISYYVMWLCY